jgi:hypothetical protein
MWVVVTVQASTGIPQQVDGPYRTREEARGVKRIIDDEAWNVPPRVYVEPLHRLMTQQEMEAFIDAALGDLPGVPAAGKRALNRKSIDRIIKSQQQER